MEAWQNLSLENMEGEEWIDVSTAKNKYQVSTVGRVKRLAGFQRGKSGSQIPVKEKIKKQRILDGYPKIGLSINGKVKSYFVHRLVAEAFIPKIEGKNFVNHKFGNRKDNRVSQLEWCTMSENIKHSFEVNGRIPPNIGKVGADSSRGVPVIAINRFTGEEFRFESGNLATQKLGLTPGSLHRALTGQYKYTKDFYIKYA